MTAIHVVLSTEPKGGKGGVATVIPLHLELLGAFGGVVHIPTHRSIPVWGKLVPWLISFFGCINVTRRYAGTKKLFHVHPGSGFCLLRMLALTAFLRLLLRQSVFVYLHTPYLERYLESRFWRHLIAALVRLSTRTVALTRHAKDLLERHGLSKKIKVIPNPYRQETSVARAKKEKDGICRVLVMGRIVPGKGFLETLRAFAQLPEHFHLIVAGEGPLVEAMRAEGQELALMSRVEWVGWISGDAKQRLLDCVDVFCLPSRVDSFGMSFVEAQYHDLPIVAFRHPPVLEVIRCEQAVYVDSLDPATLARAVIDAARLAGSIEPGSGRRWIEDHFGLSRVTRIVEEAITEISDTD
ncbi:glycosyl transferase family 1 [Caballeronia novacaledonica]|uniref:Glycosyl transferase family 1 n=1 Tax=Caballeronia novacaledonica TaxID=1544861 RepID=A0A2U3I1P9_9BURK|nr:glycosyltransferase family 4 protein [Caballeronia novacaledonica]SPB14046.1 glycosyl transferase family 1 [Caballeronia novacaledonica]